MKYALTIAIGALFISIYSFYEHETECKKINKQQKNQILEKIGQNRMKIVELRWHFLQTRDSTDLIKAQKYFQINKELFKKL
jgi:hypothetical protein